MVGHFPSAVIHPIGLRIGLDVLLMISIDIILIVCYEKYQDIPLYSQWVYCLWILVDV